jgi:hypothetical protein
MSTALDIITDALIDLGAIDPIEDLTADEASHGLRRLNEMLASWSLESLAVYQILNEGFATVAGTASYSIGSGATWNTTRPLRIESAFLRYSSTDYPLRILSREEYDAITLKTTQFMPEVLYFEPSVANAVIYLYGVPDAVYTVYLNSLKQLQSFTALTTTVVLPPGYLRAIKANLSLELAPAYNRRPPDAVLAIARESKANIKRLNSRTPKLRLDHLQLGGSGASDMAAFTAGYQ